MDLTPFINQLSDLGPWGVIAGAVLTLVLQRIARRPTPSPAPVDPLAPPAPPARPLLGRLRDVLRLLLTPPPVAAAAVAPEPDLASLYLRAKDAAARKRDELVDEANRLMKEAEAVDRQLGGK